MHRVTSCSVVALVSVFILYTYVNVYISDNGYVNENHLLPEAASANSAARSVHQYPDSSQQRADRHVVGCRYRE